MANKFLTGLTRHRLEGKLLVLQVQEQAESWNGYNYDRNRADEIGWRDACVEDFQMVKLTGYAPPTAAYPSNEPVP